MMERPSAGPVTAFAHLMSATQEWERCDGKEAIQTRVEDVGREKQAQRQGARGSHGSQAEGRDQCLGAGSRRRRSAERRLSLIRPELQIFATGPPPKPCAAAPISGEHCCRKPPGK